MLRIETIAFAISPTCAGDDGDASGHNLRRVIQD